MTSIEIVKQLLEKWHFPILHEEETFVLLRYQLAYIQIGNLNEDDQFISVLMSEVFHADDERELRIGMKVCNDLNLKLKLSKFYLDQDNDLIISVEFIYPDEEDVESLLKLALDNIVNSKRIFETTYREMEAEAKKAVPVLN